MKKRSSLYRIAFLLILLIPLASAIQFSPTSLEFNLEKEEVLCKKINFQVETPTALSDVWAKNSFEQWSISRFQSSSQEYAIKVWYPEEVNPTQNQIELCLSGSTPGEYHGALVFRQDETGSSIIQFAVWLKVIIKSSDKELIKSSDKESHVSGGSSGILWTSESLSTQTQSTQTEQKNIQKSSSTIPQEKITLNKRSKNQTQSTQNKLNQILLIIFPIIMIIALVILLLKRR
jgi:sensor c-di-GMP phosphodiesterase-like protein